MVRGETKGGKGIAVPGEPVSLAARCTHTHLPLHRRCRAGDTSQISLFTGSMKAPALHGEAGSDLLELAFLPLILEVIPHGRQRRLEAIKAPVVSEEDEVALVVKGDAPSSKTVREAAPTLLRP